MNLAKPTLMPNVHRSKQPSQVMWEVVKREYLQDYKIAAISSHLRNFKGFANLENIHT